MTIGHNNPPSMIDAAKEAAAAVALWLVDHPVIESEEKAREAKVHIDRLKLNTKDLEDERKVAIEPLNIKIKATNDLYRPSKDAITNVLQEISRRVTDFIAKEEARRIKAAEEARQKAAEAERIAREAEQREHDAASEADSGVLVDVAAVKQSADEAFSSYQRAERQAAIADRDTKVRIGGGFSRAVSLREKETLSVLDACAAINAIGMTEDIEAAIVRAARTYRRLHGELPPGIESRKERTL